MFKKAVSSFYVCFGKVLLILQLRIWTNHAEFCGDTFTIYNDKTMTVSNDVTIQNSMSSVQCIAKCRSNVKCCAASYSEATMELIKLFAFYFVFNTQLFALYKRYKISQGLYPKYISIYAGVPLE
jgi:hypothetical protein